MATVIPLKSLITFLIVAWVIISWTFRMPPRSSPMMTSTIAISTKVKPVSVDFLRLKSDAFIWTPLLMERLEVLAQQVLIHTGFHISRDVRSRERSGICRALQLRADLAARWFAVVHLPVDGACDFFRQIREAYDRAGEAQATCADHSRLYADEAAGCVRRGRPASGSRRQAGDESGDAQMLPEQVGFRRGCRSAPGTGDVIGIVKTRYDPVAVTARRILGGPARLGVLVVAGNGAVAVLIGGHGHGDAVEIVNDVLDLCLGDHLLAFQDAAEEQSDDHEHDGDFDQGETRLGGILSVARRTHRLLSKTTGVQIRQKLARFVPESMPRQPPFYQSEPALFVEKWTLTTTIRHFALVLSRGLASGRRFQLFKAFIQESQFGRVLDGPALEIPPDDETGGFQLIHVFKDEDLHLLRPEGDVVGDGVALDRSSIAECKRRIMKPVLGDGGGMGKPRPATIGIEQELPINELEHAALLRLDGHFGIQPARGEEWVLAARVQFQYPREPGF